MQGALHQVIRVAEELHRLATPARPHRPATPADPLRPATLGLLHPQEAMLVALHLATRAAQGGRPLLVCM